MKTLIALLLFAHAMAQAAAPAPDEFAWRATVEAPAGASLVRVEVPGAAMARLQGADAQDVRVFNAAGEALPFAWSSAPPPARPPEVRTAPFAALPLYTVAAGSARPKGAVQVRIGEGSSQSVWVRLDGSAERDAQRLSSVLFATQQEKKPWSALDVQGTLPANTPVRMAVSTSTDLANWTPAPVRGRLFRFEGASAPGNLRLEFEAPLRLEGRYLRLDWGAQEGIALTAVTGVVAPAAAPPRRVTVPLTGWREAAPDAMELETGFASPLAALGLSAARDNTLVPVRVLGRNDAGQPWRTLGQGVVYRLQQEGQFAESPPLELHGASVRFLRIASTDGTPLAPARLNATAQFPARQLVFVATGTPPFTLAAGRTRTDPAALPLQSIAGTLGERKVEDLPLATLGAPVEAAGGGGWWPGAPGKATLLWSVLGAGVLALGLVAWTLLRQLGRPTGEGQPNAEDPPPAEG